MFFPPVFSCYVRFYAIIFLFFFFFPLSPEAVWFSPLASKASICKAIMQDNAPLNEYNADGYTGLMKAALEGNFEVVKCFVEHGAKVNMQATTKSVQKGATALALTILNTNMSMKTDIIDYLLAHGADPNIANAMGETSLHAILDITDQNLRFKVLELLLKRGTNINAQTNEGNTMMHLTVEKKDKHWIVMVRDNYSSLLDLRLKNKKGLDVYELAKVRGDGGPDWSILQYLEQPEPVLGQGYGKLNERNSLGQNGLMAAILRNDRPFFLRMVDQGVNINDADQNGDTALFYAVRSEDPVYYFKKVLAAGANIHQRNKNGKTVLLLVPLVKNKKDRLAIAKDLLQKGASVDTSDDEKQTLWHEAVKNYDYSLVQFLKKTLGNIEKNQQGKTALEFAQAQLDSNKTTPAQKKKLRKIIAVLQGK